jgi:sn-glycerol 3-phosphate transport system substrate-binding protein
LVFLSIWKKTPWAFRRAAATGRTCPRYRQSGPSWNTSKKPESQAKWHIETGYFAINPAAYNEEIVKQEWEKYPQFKVTVEQLQHTKPSVATQGALISVFPESRQQVVTALENLYQGTDPQKALDQAVEGTNRAIEIANKTKQ